MDKPCDTNHDASILELQETIQKTFSFVQQAVIKSNRLPQELSHKLYSTHSHFRQVTEQLGRNVLGLSNFILSLDYPKAKFKNGELENNFEKLIDINNDELDKIQLKLERVKKGMTKNNEDEELFKRPNENPVLLCVQKNNKNLLTASNIIMPQLKFKDKIDNTHELWMPVIKYKANNIQPLQIQLEVDDDGNTVGYNHPYQIELDLYEPPENFMKPDEDDLALPPPLESTKFTYVDTMENLQYLMSKLSSATEIAVDLEHHSFHSYQGFTCLIQISIQNEDFVIDALNLRHHLHLLNESFTDPKKLKVFHGASNDILWLQRDFGVYVVGMFDTYEASLCLNFTEKKLLNLLRRFCNVNTNKQYQTADWRMRPIPEELMIYARTDTHYLIYIWRQLKKLLLNKEGGKSLRQVFENSKRICLSRYNKPIVTPTSHLELYNRSQKKFNSRQLAALKLLYKWRDDNARLIDKSVEYIMSKATLLRLAEELPSDTQSATLCCQGSSWFLRQNMMIVLALLNPCRNLPLEPEQLHTPASIVSVLQHVEEENQTEVLQALSSDLTLQDRPLPIMEPFTPEKDDILCESRVITNNCTKQFLPPYERYKYYRYLIREEYFGTLSTQQSDASTVKPLSTENAK